MSSLSRTLARADARGQKLMTQHQPYGLWLLRRGPQGAPGKVKAAIRRHRQNHIARRARRANR